MNYSKNSRVMMYTEAHNLAGIRGKVNLVFAVCITVFFIEKDCCVVIAVDGHNSNTVSA